MLPPDDLNMLIGEIIETFGGHIAEFFAFLFAVALSAGTISSEIDRGVLAVVLPKPIGRWSVYCGKWLGVNAFVLMSLIVWVALLQFAIYNHIHQTMPNLWKAYLIMALYPLVFSSLTLFFSSFTSNLLSIVLPLTVASCAWTEGLLKTLGYGLDVNSLKIASKVVVYAAPLNPMSRWLDRVLDPQVLGMIQQFRRPTGPPDPPANWIDLGWIIGYGLAAFIAGMILFQRRDL
jgi:ABC-type transport system involved in multi-copper enzyme maturation permease subunit